MIDITRERERENHTDIKRIVKLPKDIDILTYSFPCQDLSQQGKQRGMNQNTRSGLLYEVERILNENTDRLPKILLLENVKALVSKKFIGDFEKWIDILDKIGYKSKYKVLNAANYGSSQNRERVFMVSILKSEKIDFEFPNKEIQIKSKLNKIINNPYDGNNLNHLFNYKMNEFVKTKNNIVKSKLCDYTNFNSEAYIYKTNSLGPTLTASGANSRLKFYFEKEKIIRYINEIEAYQYMGFDIKDALKVKESKLISPNKMIFTAGNSICVEVLEAIFKTIKECYERK
ncbi:DNA (cytosine-5-)-methyltransferase [Mycoplasmopsis bovigenitalium]|uniref:DNA (cytosine-5-)-methyltransferase n=1 Tax=Mycoplasmopsis bovigenitalium TaxID=2112 RepID=UPI000909AAAE|nr:DNA (cytosine-5-)-methyltransferase [Mycoplasmopsis bovigenitalium]BAW18233.1 DNA (cytosine-5-)-methyltransferase [Mycoplasmopsis bovigenitalium]